mgnify:CR=1 FL=1
MKNIGKSDYEKLKRQFNIKMGNETFPLAIAFWAVMGIMLGAFLMIISKFSLKQNKKASFKRLCVRSDSTIAYTLSL